MHNPQEDRIVHFWTAFQQLYLDLYGSSLAICAAIEGHAPAAGCMLALSCDYRVMSATTDKMGPTIGLNETKLGIVAPTWLGFQFIDTVGPREAELGLSLGHLYSPEEALERGLVDKVCPQPYVEEKAYVHGLDTTLLEKLSENAFHSLVPYQSRHGGEVLQNFSASSCGQQDDCSKASHRTNARDTARRPRALS